MFIKCFKLILLGGFVTSLFSGAIFASERYILKASSSLGAQQVSQGLMSRATDSHSSDPYVILENLSEQEIQDLKNSDSTDYLEPLYPVSIFEAPNDPYYIEQTYLSQTPLQFLRESQGDTEVIVAIVDTGVDINHQDLSQHIYLNTKEVVNQVDDDGNGFIDDVTGYNFQGYSEGSHSNEPMDLQSHGTHLAGIMAAQSNNGVGVTGLSSKIKILPIKFLDNNGRGDQYDAAVAIRYAVDQGAKIINCSWGYYKYNSVLKEAVDYALSHGVVVIAAVGNTNTNILEYPASFPGVLTVGSVDDNNSRSYFSSFSDQLDFMTFGSHIFSTMPYNRYGSKSGTSQSAAVMSSVVATIMSHDPTASTFDVMNILKSVSTYDRRDRRFGFGTLDYSRLSAMLTGAEDLVSVSQLIPQSSLENVLNFPNPFKTTTDFGFSTQLAGMPVNVKIYDPSGQLLNTLESVTTLGYNTISWNGRDQWGQLLPNGTYLYVLNIEVSGSTTKQKGKVTILR